MDKKELREKVHRLISFNSVETAIEVLDVFSDFFFAVVKNHHSDQVEKISEKEARIIIQMMHTKVLSLIKLSKGISYKDKDGGRLNKIIDPTIIAGIVRNIYETAGVFHLVYRKPESEEQKEILYNLWVHSGLKYRQNLEPYTSSNENKEKQKQELAQMMKIVEEIEANSYFLNLEESEKIKIRSCIKKKEYKIYFEDSKVKIIKWFELHAVLGAKQGLLDPMYNYFSLFAHPSNVSVFQFAEMFEQENEQFKKTTIFVIRNAIMFLSFFTADYINLFPNVLQTFDKTDLVNQCVIHFFNNGPREHKYIINNSFEALN